MASRKERKALRASEREKKAFSEMRVPVFAKNLYQNCRECENNCPMVVDSLDPEAFLEPVTRHICKLKCRKDLFTQRRLHEEEPFDYKIMNLFYGDLKATCPYFAIAVVGNDEYMRK